VFSEKWIEGKASSVRANVRNSGAPEQECMQVDEVLARLVGELRQARLESVAPTLQLRILLQKDGPDMKKVGEIHRANIERVQAPCQRAMRALTKIEAAKKVLDGMLASDPGPETDFAKSWIDGGK
jgi:hypothetical protein